LLAVPGGQGRQRLLNAGANVPGTQTCERMSLIEHEAGSGKQAGGRTSQELLPGAETVPMGQALHSCAPGVSLNVPAAGRQQNDND
jgi:hypothetical protein